METNINFAKAANLTSKSKEEVDSPMTVNVTNKDTYMSIAHMAEDREVLLMLTRNRYFNDPRFFKEILQKRYPLLMSFRKEGEDWKALYIRMIKYIALLSEEYKEYEVVYVPAKTFNPKRVYYNLKRWEPSFFDDDFESHLRNVFAYFVGESGNEKLIDDYLEKYGSDQGVCSNLLQGIIAYGSEELLNKYLKVICYEDRQAFEDGDYSDNLIASGSQGLVELGIRQAEVHQYEELANLIRIKLIESGNLDLVKKYQDIKKRVYNDEYGNGVLIDISCFDLNDVMTSGSFEVFKYTLDNICPDGFIQINQDWVYKIYRR